MCCKQRNIYLGQLDMDEFIHGLFVDILIKSIRSFFPFKTLHSTRKAKPLFHPNCSCGKEDRKRQSHWLFKARKRYFFRLKQRVIFPPIFLQAKICRHLEPYRILLMVISAPVILKLNVCSWPLTCWLKHAGNAKNDLTKEWMLHGLTQKGPGKIWLKPALVSKSVRWELWFYYCVSELCRPNQKTETTERQRRHLRFTT